MGKDSNEIKYNNGCKLVLKSLDNIKLDSSIGKAFTSPYFWIDEVQLEILPSYTELERQYLKYLKQSDVERISLSKWCLITGKRVESNIDMDTRGIKFTLTNMPIPMSYNYYEHIPNINNEDEEE